MKILFDHQIYTMQEYGGVSRYFYELSKGLQNDLKADVLNSVCLSNNIYTNDPLYKSLKFFPGIPFKGKGRILREISKLYSKTALGGSYDVFHPTYYDPYFLNSIKKKPFVVTFYDLINEKLKHRFESLKEDDSFFEARKLLLAKASKIIAISNSTKTDIIDIYQVPSAKIDVVHLASSIESYSNIDIAYSNYILYVGSRWTYKNFKLFIEAVTPLLLKEKELKVICGGGGNFDPAELAFLNGLKIIDQVIQVPLNDQLLSALYTNALFFIFPSLYEGFGIPVLEAFSCSCATLLSNTSSLPEVGSDAALYFNPDDKEDILDKITKLFYDAELRNTLKNAGFERQKMFSWSQTVKDHHEIYKTVI